MFNKHEEIYVASEETLKKEINVGALNYPLKRTVDSISLSLPDPNREAQPGPISFAFKIGRSVLASENSWSPKIAIIIQAISR